MKHRNAFTILEVMIVVVIVGVLASLALPRFFSIVERTRALEGIALLQQIRGYMERCYVSRNLTYTGCDPLALYNASGVPPNRHFIFNTSNIGANTYRVYLERNSHELMGVDPGGSWGTAQCPGGSDPNHSHLMACQHPTAGFGILGSGFYAGIDTFPK